MLTVSVAPLPAVLYVLTRDNPAGQQGAILGFIFCIAFAVAYVIVFWSIKLLRKRRGAK